MPDFSVKVGGSFSFAAELMSHNLVILQFISKMFPFVQSGSVPSLAGRVRNESLRGQVPICARGFRRRNNNRRDWRDAPTPAPRSRDDRAAVFPPPRAA